MDNKRVHISPQLKAVRRFLKNIPALVGLIVIVISVFISIFSYFIMPDSTRNADEQVLSLRTENPGVELTFLTMVRNKQVEDVSWFQRVLDGSPSYLEWIPIQSYSFEKEFIKLKLYEGKNEAGEEVTFLLADVLYALSPDSDTSKSSFSTLDGKTVNRISSDYKNIVMKHHIVQKKFLLGTDKNGRDILSRMILGTRVSLTVGLVSVLISLLIGVFLGALAGYFGSWVDDLISWFISVFWSIPTFLLAMGLAISVGGSKSLMIYIAVGLTMWVDMARIVRQQFISLRKSEFVEASQSLGFSHLRTIFKHILPNIMGPLVVIMASDFANAILIEAGLSFLGLGVQPPKPSWGQMLSEYRDFLNTDKSYLTLIPGFAVMILVLSFNLIGNGLRDALDVRPQTRI